MVAFFVEWYAGHTLAVVCAQVTFDLKHQLLSALEWYRHSPAATSGAGRHAHGLACVPEKVLVDNPVFDVRVAAWMMDPDNKKVRSGFVSNSNT